MISVKEAQRKIVDTVKPSREIKLDLAQAAGHVLSKNVYAPLDLPPFDQSAMDGYALLAEDFETGKKINISGESSAGKSFGGKISSGLATRIFTGAEIPEGADAVVMQEKVVAERTLLNIKDEALKRGLNIRRRGSQIKKGELALGKGMLLNPGGIGFLASMGLINVSVIRKPAVSIIVTGNELQKAGQKLSRGMIYESNAAALIAALKMNGIESVRIFFTGDDQKKIRKNFRHALTSSDIILFTGGISVGDYDFVGKVLKEEKVNEIFYKVSQKPGKPLYFGVKNRKYILGLPGNPASVLTCFYEYVVPAIRKSSGFADCFLPSLFLPITKTFQKKSGMTNFLKAFTDFKTVTPLDGQESYIMRTFASANCLAIIPENTETVKDGDLVEVHLL